MTRNGGFPSERPGNILNNLTLEIFQAGLSWRTILHKRAEFRKEFLRFSPEKVALFTEKDIRRILGNPGVVRNRKKIEATIENAKRFLAIQKKHGSFNRYLASLPDDLDHRCKRYSARNSPSWDPKIAEAYLESVGKIPELHDPRCWRNKKKIDNHLIYQYNIYLFLKYIIISVHPFVSPLLFSEIPREFIEKPREFIDIYRYFQDFVSSRLFHRR